ncbi:phosphoglycerate dehydrogenase [Psychrobacillus sp. BM2]|uniref:phosphoglycerate dehydrogenase n=1 Tax=Psychrobacillus sp. BM2 TaxID=3400421 RepID=UPI003B01D392
MAKILITPKSFQKYKQKPFEMLLAAGYEIIENTSGKTLSEDNLLELATEDIAGIIVGVDPLPPRVLEAFKGLKAISKYGVGMDNIDLEKAKEMGISVRNAIGTNNISVAELAIGLMFESGRRLSSTINEVKQLSWDRIIGTELTNKNLSVFGGGQIGKEVAKRARGLEMNVTIYDPYFNDQEFLDTYEVTRTEEFLDAVKQADILTLHLPVTEDTKHLINENILIQMKPSAILINTARGELVDEKALYEALNNGTIAVAAQDVYSQEPPSKGDSLVQLPNFILTPHIGAYTNEAVERMAVVSTRNLLEMLEI